MLGGATSHARRLGPERLSSLCLLTLLGRRVLAHVNSWARSDLKVKQHPESHVAQGA